MSDLALVYALYPDHGSAREAAHAMIERRLAACANIMAGIRSVYRWEGAVREEDEVPVLFKTTQDQAEGLTRALAESHPYAVPAILRWPAGATAPCAAWVTQETIG